MKIKKGDVVKVVLGKDAGKTGKVEKVMTGKHAVMVEGVNQYKRHVKARAQGQKSEIITITKPLNVAKVAVLCPKCKEPTRIGYVVNKDAKQRICKKCHAEL
jgi:large subunit ribosomal protein L24